MVAGKDLKLDSLSPTVLTRAKGCTRRATRRLLQELRSWFLISIEVSNESSVSACLARQLSTQAVNPILIVFAKASNSIINTESKRTVNLTKPRERAVDIRGRRRLNPWW